MSAAFALFAIAVFANYFIIKHVPDIDVIEKLPEEEQGLRDVGMKEAFGFTVGASCTLVTLYLFKDQLMVFVEL